MEPSPPQHSSYREKGKRSYQFDIRKYSPFFFFSKIKYLGQWNRKGLALDGVILSLIIRARPQQGRSFEKELIDIGSKTRFDNEARA